MQQVLCVNKPIGKTPLEMIDLQRQRYPEYAEEKMAYAGRLDPMAEGLLLILVGDECKKRKEYEKLQKIYEFDVLFGIATDSYDVMGMITQTDFSVRKDQQVHLKGILPKFIGKHTQPYPPFSSARVNGKPLFYWARENRLGQITVPTKEIEIYSLKMLSSSTISGQELLTTVNDRVAKVKGRFRQKEIMQQWSEVLKEGHDTLFPLLKFSISCSSGTYVRSIAHKLGKNLDTPSMAFSIRRTNVRDYSLGDSLLS